MQSKKVEYKLDTNKEVACTKPSLFLNVTAHSNICGKKFMHKMLALCFVKILNQLLLSCDSLVSRFSQSFSAIDSAIKSVFYMEQKSEKIFFYLHRVDRPHLRRIHFLKTKGKGFFIAFVSLFIVTYSLFCHQSFLKLLFVS